MPGPETIFVVGATGNLGSAVARNLISPGFKSGPSKEIS
jgi:nucleoside-diphosphate-sugar epimerase